MLAFTLVTFAERGPNGLRSGLQAPLSLVRTRASSLAEPSRPPEKAPFELPGPAPFLHQALTFAEQQPLVLAGVQAGMLRCVGDRVAQQLYIYRGELAGLDPQHIAAMGLVGLFVSGCGGFLWLNHLESTLGATKGPADVLRKTVTDFLCWAPIANCMYLFCVPFLTGTSVNEAALNMETQFLPTMATELSIFGPYNLLAFSMIPLRARPISSALASLLFTIAIAARC